MLRRLVLALACICFAPTQSWPQSTTSQSRGHSKARDEVPDYRRPKPGIKEDAQRRLEQRKELPQPPQPKKQDFGEPQTEDERRLLGTIISIADDFKKKAQQVNADYGKLKHFLDQAKESEGAVSELRLKDAECRKISESLGEAQRTLVDVERASNSKVRERRKKETGDEIASLEQEEAKCFYVKEQKARAIAQNLEAQVVAMEEVVFISKRIERSEGPLQAILQSYQLAVATYRAKILVREPTQPKSIESQTPKQQSDPPTALPEQKVPLPEEKQAPPPLR